MKPTQLNDLLKQITPLPWGDKEHTSERFAHDCAYGIHAANVLPELVKALEDCVESLKRLNNKDGAFRVTCITEGTKALALAQTIKEK